MWTLDLSDCLYNYYVRVGGNEVADKFPSMKRISFIGTLINGGAYPQQIYFWIKKDESKFNFFKWVR